MTWEYWLIVLAIIGFGYWLEDAISEIRERTRRIEERLDAMQVSNEDFD